MLRRLGWPVNLFYVMRIKGLAASCMIKNVIIHEIGRGEGGGTSGEIGYRRRSGRAGDGVGESLRNPTRTSCTCGETSAGGRPYVTVLNAMLLMVLVFGRRDGFGGVARH